ncbi:MAG: hypothetical protein Q4B26_12380 [Eubacteriales bacterium]|nr:hypothetical protein [Eubacteriales bacterium]
MWPFSSKKKKEKHLLRWQKVIVKDSPNHLIMSEEKLRQLTELQAQNDIRIIKDSIRIIKTTRNQETRSSRLSLLKGLKDDLDVLDEFMGRIYKDVLKECDTVLKQ